MALHSDDGMIEHGCSYTTFDVINEQHKLLVYGWMCLLGSSGLNVVLGTRLQDQEMF